MIAEPPSLPLESARSWKPGRIWRETAHFPEMIDLPRGAFAMGEQPDDKFSSDLERPRHLVEIRAPMALGRFPVTVAQYAAFSGDDFAEEEAALPVVGVAWEEAVAYCDWLSFLSGRAYRLPSEAQWEYACRAGGAASFPLGETLAPNDANYLYDEAGGKVGPGCRTPAGRYPANAFGLYDMAGNVCEWVADEWHAGFAGAPAGGESWQTFAQRGRRVIRGGAWDYLPRLLRCCWRDFLDQHTRRDNVGFRIACTLEGNAS